MKTDCNNPAHQVVITDQEWQVIADLIRDVEETEQREELVAALSGWHLAVRAFQRLENLKMIHETPKESDYLFHNACLHMLISIGKFLLLDLKKDKPEKLTAYGFSIEDLQAYLQELEYSLEEWHGKIPEERKKQILKGIFDGKTHTGRKVA